MGRSKLSSLHRFIRRLSHWRRWDVFKRVHGWHYSALLAYAGENLKISDNVKLANPANPAEIAAAIRRILDDPACYGRRGLNARTAAAHFTWALEARQLLQVYRQLDKGG